MTDHCKHCEEKPFCYDACDKVVEWEALTPADIETDYKAVGIELTSYAESRTIKDSLRVQKIKRIRAKQRIENKKKP